MSSREKIFKLLEEHYKEELETPEFIPGETPVPVSGKFTDVEDLKYLIDASLDFWLTEGRFTDDFERGFSEFLGIRHVAPVNSGSSANLIAFSALTSDKYKDRKINKGDEVITVASGFPTTVNPIIQNGCVPVFVDCELETYNINTEAMKEALSEKTKAVMIAHTLGNPFDLGEVTKFCEDNDLWLIEDSCDALGAKYNSQYVGTFGKFGTFSFYPAHHITMGEGGAVITQKKSDFKVLESFRDWGRDCWCASGHDDTCNKRFDWQLGDLPYGYDHKFTYSNIGYNLKATDLQASIGVAQMDKLQKFIDARKENWKKINNFILKFDEYFLPHTPTENSDPSWFGYAITVKDNKYFKRDDLVKFLNEKRIGTRLIFGGNLISHPILTKHYRIYGG